MTRRVSSAQLDIPTVFKGAVFKLVFFNYLSIKSSDEPTIKGWPLRAPAAAFRDDGSKDAPPPPPTPPSERRPPDTRHGTCPARPRRRSVASCDTAADAADPPLPQRPSKSHMNKYNSPKRNDLEVEQRGVPVYCSMLVGLQQRTDDAVEPVLFK